MNKEEVKQRKLQIQDRVQFLNKLIGDPEVYGLDINKLKDLETERKQLFDEYKRLPPPEVIIESEVHKEIFYLGDRFTIKNGYLYEGSEALTKNIKFIDENTIECRKIIVSSDTLGLPIEMVYRLNIVPKPPEQSKPDKIEKPCSIQEAGENIMKMREQYLDPNSEYFKSLGLVFDKNLKVWRKPTPQEYAEFSKKIAEKKSIK